MGVRTRLLWFVLPVAALAVVLSAVVVRQVTTDQLQQQVTADDQVTERITSALNDYSFTGESWAAAEPLIVDLSVTQGIRIAISDLDGKVLLDTARVIEGESRPLPQSSSGFIDPDNPAFGLEVSPEVLAYWDDQAELFDDCMAAAGFGDYLVDIPFPDEGDFGIFEDQLKVCSVETYDVDPLLSDAGIAEGIDLIDADSFLAPELSPLEPVLLFLGERGDSASVLDATIDSRMIASVVVILLVAVLATYLFARRTLGPISALTEAAHQVAAGNTPEPVEVLGDTELSELAVAFNSMGDTLRHEDEARRRLTFAPAAGEC